MLAVRRPSAPGRAEWAFLYSWVGFLAFVIIGPALAPGYVLSYDMVWVPELSVTRADVWGLGSALPRAVPSDAVAATLGVVIPQQLLQKLLLVAALVAAGAGGAALARDLGPAGRWAAATLMVWNPFIAERLGLGHWPLLLAYAATPWLVLAVRDRRFARGTVLLAVTALSPASGVMGAIVALVVGRPRDVWRWGLVALAVNAPWIVASLTSPAGILSDSSGVGVFAARGAESTPVWLEVASLAGVWNADVRPPSRETWFATVLALVLVAVVVVGLSRLLRCGDTVVRPLAGLWVVGFVVALAGAVAPNPLEALIEVVPGSGMVRDGSRWVLLMAPATALGLAAFVDWLTSRPATTAVGWLVAVGLPIALVPDLGWGIGGRLAAVDYPDDWEHVRSALVEQDEPGDLLSLPFSAFRAPQWNHYRPVLDPAGRYFDRVTVTSDALMVGDVVVAGEDPRAERIGRALPAGDWQAVADEGVRFVVLDTSAAGAKDEEEHVAGLPIVIEAGSLQLFEVPGAVEPTVGRARTAAVLGGWLVAVVAVGAGLAGQIGRRRKITRGT